MGKFFDEMVGAAEYAAAQDARGEAMPSRSEIGTDPLSASLARTLRDRHTLANCYRMAEAIAAEGQAVEAFIAEYGGLPAADDGEAVAEFLYEVRRKVEKRGGAIAIEVGGQGGDLIAQLLAAADDDEDEGAGAGRAARVEEPRGARGGDAR